jgi:hypothetical protein
MIIIHCGRVVIFQPTLPTVRKFVECYLPCERQNSAVTLCSDHQKRARATVQGPSGLPCRAPSADPLVRYNQSPEHIELEGMQGRPFRPDEARRKFAHTSGAPSRSVAARRPQSILHRTRVQEFIALFVL